jgi:hypothetical protein
MPDGSGGATFPLEAGVDVVLVPLEAITATFDVTINPNVDSVANTASASSPGLPPASGTVGVPIKVADYELDKRLISPADGQAIRGDVITYNLVITSTGNISITKLPLRDAVDPTQLTFLNATPPPDLVTAGVITWTDLATPSLFGYLDPNRTIVLTTSYRVNNVAADVTSLTNTATVEGAQGADGSPLPTKSDQAQVQVPSLKASYIFDKRLIAPANGQAQAGDVITFGLTITSTGNLTIAKMALRDTFDENHLTFHNSTPTADSNQPGLTVWTNLINNFGLLSPGQTISLTVAYTVDPVPSGVLNTTNVATVDGVEDSLGNGLPPLTDMATVNFPATPVPSLTPTPVPATPIPAPKNAPPNNDTDDDNDDEDSPAQPIPPSPTLPSQTSAAVPATTVPGVPNSGPAAPVEPGATPTLPVTLLPETGLKGISSEKAIMGMLLLFTTLGMTTSLVWLNRKRNQK